MEEFGSESSSTKSTSSSEADRYQREPAPPADASPREGDDDDRPPSNTSTDVSSSSGSGRSSVSPTEAQPQKLSNATKNGDTNNSSNHHSKEVEREGDSDSDESETNSKIMSRMLDRPSGSSGSEEEGSRDESLSETEEMKMRRILYGSRLSSSSNNHDHTQEYHHSQSGNKLKDDGEGSVGSVKGKLESKNHGSLSSIGGAGTTIAHRSIIADTVMEPEDEKQMDGGDAGHLLQDTGHSQSYSSSGTSRESSTNVSRSNSSSSRSDSSMNSKDRGGGISESGSDSRSSQSASKSPSGSFQGTRSESVTAALLPPLGSPVSRQKLASGLPRSSSATPFPRQNSPSEPSGSIASEWQRSASSSRSHPRDAQVLSERSESSSRSPSDGKLQESGKSKTAPVDRKDTIKSLRSATGANDAKKDSKRSKESLSPSSRDPPAESSFTSRSATRDPVQDHHESSKNILQPLNENRKWQLHKPEKHVVSSYSSSGGRQTDSERQDVARDPVSDVPEMATGSAGTNSKDPYQSLQSKIVSQGVVSHQKSQSAPALAKERELGERSEKDAQEQISTILSTSRSSPKPPRYKWDAASNRTKEDKSELLKRRGSESALIEDESKKEHGKEAVWSPARKIQQPLYTVHKITSHDTDDWMPPALTTYGEQKFIPPQQQGRGKLDPDTGKRSFIDDTPPIQLPQRPVKRSDEVQSKGKKMKAGSPKEQNVTRPPVVPPLEITIISSLDDESTLGTDGTYLDRFPKNKKKDNKKTVGHPVVIPRFAQDDSVAAGQEVKEKDTLDNVKSPVVVHRSVQDNSVAGGYENYGKGLTVVPRFAQRDSVAGGNEVTKKLAPETLNDPVMTPRFAHGDSIAGAYELKTTEQNSNDHDSGVPLYVGAPLDAGVQETSWVGQSQKLVQNVRKKELEDDYYRSWIQADQEKTDQAERQDPPGTANFFPFNPSSPEGKEHQDTSAHPVPVSFGVNRSALYDSNWVPEVKRPEEIKPEISRNDSIPSLPRYYYKSENSMDLPWGDDSKGRTLDELDLEVRRRYIDSIMAQKRSTQKAKSRSRVAPTGRSARIDHTGKVCSTSPSRSSSSTPSSSTGSNSARSQSLSGFDPSLTPSQRSRSSQSASISSQSTPKPRRVMLPNPLLGETEKQSDASRTMEVVGDTSRTVPNMPTRLTKIDDRTENSRTTEVEHETSRIGSKPLKLTTVAENPAKEVVDECTTGDSIFMGTVKGGRPEQPPFQQTEKGTRPCAPPVSKTMIIIVILSVFLVMGVVGCCLYFFLPVFRDNNDTLSPSTSDPTPEPTIDTSLEGLRDMVVSVSPETDSAFNNPDSFQTSALEWLSRNQFLTTYSSEQLLQRFVMATLYFSSNGDDWKRKDLWLSNITECEWYSAETQTDVCDDRGLIDEIYLKENGLAGSLPWTELGILSSHLILDIYSNQVSGTIATSIGKLTSLLALDLQDNGFEGTIPTEFQHLKSMKHLILAENQLTGTIPSELAGMTDLESLNLRRNSLRGSIPEALGRMSNLRNVFLDGNNLSGTIPSELCAMNLERLVIDCGSVSCSCCTCANDGTSPSVNVQTPSPPPTPTSGPIAQPAPTGSPTSAPEGPSPSIAGDNLRDLVIDAYPDGQIALQDPDSPQSQALRWLESSANDAVSSEEGFLQRYALATLYYSTNGDNWNDKTAWLTSTNECSWTSTTNSLDVCDESGSYVSLDLQANNLQGSIPAELILLSDSLNSINIRDNVILGGIPTILNELVDLESFDVSSNSMTGSIPISLFDATNLRRLSLYQNEFSSTLSSEVGKLTRLELLDIGSNRLNGTLPPTLGRLTRLAGLSVVDNSFTGTLPAELSSLKSLQVLYVDSNDFRAPLPTDICLLNLDEFWSDCEKISCVCCTTCCSDNFGCFET